MSSQTQSTQESPSTPSPSQTSGGNKFTQGNNTSNLYLVTFLATLFLLLFISCAIVLRSYILRRRFQRQLDDAIAAGVVLAPRTQGSRKRRFGTKPKFYDAWVAQGGEKWDEMLPVSAQPVQVKRRTKNATSPSSPESQEPQSPISPSEPQQRPLHQNFFRVIRRRDDINAHQPTITVSDTDKPPRPRVDMLQISILIAMPSVDRPLNYPAGKLEKKVDDDDDEVIPEVVFGVTRLPYKLDQTT